MISVDNIKIGELEKEYENCENKGSIKFKKEIDNELVKSLFDAAIEGKERAKNVKSSYEEKSGNYGFLFVEQYDILRKLIDAFLFLSKVSCDNHICSNAYLCMKHKDLEFDWRTLETIRKLRNSVQYKGIRIGEEVWKSYKLKFEVYINSLIKILEKRLNELT